MDEIPYCKVGAFSKRPDTAASMKMIDNQGRALEKKGALEQGFRLPWRHTLRAQLGKKCGETLQPGVVSVSLADEVVAVRAEGRLIVCTVVKRKTDGGPERRLGELIMEVPNRRRRRGSMTEDFSTPTLLSPSMNSQSQKPFSAEDTAREWVEAIKTALLTYNRPKRVAVLLGKGEGEGGWAGVQS